MLSIRYILICTEKSLSLERAKTDKVDARTIASMLVSDVNLSPTQIHLTTTKN